MSIKLMSVACLAFALTCCVTTTMTGIMESWRGAHVEDVVAQWGNPSEVRPFHGNRLFVWHYQKAAGIPMTSRTTIDVAGNRAYATTVTNGGGVISGNCTRVLEVNASDTVVDYRWSGYNCPFLELMEYSDWRKSVR